MTYSGEPNKSTVEKLFVGLSLNHVENFQMAVGAFRSSWGTREAGFSVIADSLNRVLALENELAVGVSDFDKGTIDVEEGQLLIWDSSLQAPEVLESSRRSNR